MDEQRAQSRNPTDLPLGLDVIHLITQANDESARRHHEYIGTEHLVLALSQPGGAAAPLLALAIEPQRLHTTVGNIIRRGKEPVPSDIERPLTSRTRQAFFLAATAARELGHSHIGVPHLLVGLMRERMNIGAQILADQGLTEQRAFELARDTGT
jgi:ATP-dependent Clp protease ATP-binding subunit ClpC